LWLGYHALHKDILEPRFRIDGRFGKKDRAAIISVDPSDTFNGYSVGGCDNNVFRTTQAGIYLRIISAALLDLPAPVYPTSGASFLMSLSSVRRIASAMFWPCETRTSTCRNPRRSLQACIASSALPSFMSKDIVQVGPLQRLEDQAAKGNSLLL
jgi:hypothetical protein